MATDGIYVRVLGDHGPFSTMGKSIGYQVTIGETSFLVDCGSPLFQQIGGHGLKHISGLIITHCHDDHKRWFTDLALFNKYAPDFARRMALFTSEKINEELAVSSGPALETSLSPDSKNVVDLSYTDYIDLHLLGPRARYRIVSRDSGGCYSFVVEDRNGAVLGPESAKVVISTRNGKPRLLFKDPEYGEWIEPECFYPFSSTVFYDDEQNLYRDAGGFTVEAINAPVWHGVPGIGLKFRTPSETLIFSGDTAHDLELWQALHTEKRRQRLLGSRRDFEAASVLYGDINDYIERIWSRERYEEAVRTFDGAVVIQDIAARNSVVHTDYRRLHHTVLDRQRCILTHSPDKMTSAWAISKADKTFFIKGKNFHEIVEGKLWSMNAAVYHKEGGKYFAGYRNPTGRETVYENDGILNMGGPWNWEKGKLLFKVDLYEDVGGKYFPKLYDDNTFYRERPDGQVELVKVTSDGSRGRIVEDQRGRLSQDLPEAAGTAACSFS